MRRNHVGTTWPTQKTLTVILTITKKKPAAVARTSPQRLQLPTQGADRKRWWGQWRGQLGATRRHVEQQPAKLWTALMETGKGLVRTEHQVHAISRMQITDTFLEGQVRTWTKETLWKMCKFITNDKTMHQVMQKASKHFKVPASEQENWMSSYAHIIRDGLNQKRNACSQDLRKMIKSKRHGLHRICRWPV